MLFCQVFLGFVCTVMSTSILVNSPSKMLSSLLFVAAFNFLFVVAYKNIKKYPSFSAFSALLWLGFFGKTTMLLTFGTGIKDPIGAFDGVGAQWDELFAVTSVGVLALISSFFLYTKIIVKNQIEKVKLENGKINFQLNANFKVFALYSFVLVFVAMLNLNYGLILSGLASITHLPFKINAAVGWMLYLGFSAILSLLFMKSMSTKRYFFACVGLLFLEGFFCSVSLISRGTFIFHVVPVLLLIAFNYKFLNITIKNVMTMFVAFLAVMVVTVGAVTVTRNSLYDKYAFSNSDFSTSITLSQYSKKIDRSFVSNSIGVIGDLMINRWVGLEGTMAVVGYPDKNFALMFDSLIRIPKVGVQDVYAKISGVVYENNPKITFSFIPGPIAFLYYSGQIFCVFIGLLLMGLFLLTADDLIWRFFNNPFLTVQISAYLAVNASQIGMSPFPLVKSLVLTICGLTVLKILTDETVVSNIYYPILSKFRQPTALKAK
ncbi:hypothetical protein CIK05_07145 [Bdellovibrio sp. qaytius]|nr:hypothetical protein CIK05_07145 [Bdellovibrio sp. qaytius]